MPLHYPPTAQYGPVVRSGYYHLVGEPAGSPWGTTFTMTQSTVFYTPWVAGNAHYIARVGFSVDTSAASSSARCGIYRDATGIPGVLVNEAAATIATTSTGSKEFTFSTTPYVSAGELVWIAVVAQGGAPTFKRHSNVVKIFGGRTTLDETGSYGSYTEASITGALPSTATPAANGNADTPGLVVRAV